MTTVMTRVTKNRLASPAELRSRIYEASIRLFRERGYEQTTIDDIVKVAGVAKGTFFNFFPSKLHAIRAYYAAIDAEVSRCRAALDPAAPLASLKRYGRDVERILRREGQLMLELIDLAYGETSLRRLDEDSGELDADDFAAFLVEARRLGQIKPNVNTRRVASAVGDLWSGAVREWRRDPEGKSLSQLFAARVALLLDGVGASS